MNAVRHGVLLGLAWSIPALAWILAQGTLDWRDGVPLAGAMSRGLHTLWLYQALAIAVTVPLWSRPDDGWDWALMITAMLLAPLPLVPFVWLSGASASLAPLALGQFGLFAFAVGLAGVAQLLQRVIRDSSVLGICASALTIAGLGLIWHFSGAWLEVAVWPAK